MSFWEFLLIAAWAIFIASERSLAASILLMLAGVYLMVDAVANWGKNDD